LAGDRKGAARALTVARKQNPFVELYFSGLGRMPEGLPESYSLGSEEEAIICFENLGAAWAKHQSALFWLLDRLHGGGPS
jgi:hypothetical protein